MSLTNSNTYIESVASATLNVSRGQINKSLRSILSNFKSTALPTSVNITVSGTATNPIEGMLFRDDSKKALFIYDTDNEKTGTGFTRNGIGVRIEEGVEGLKTNAESYEIGELISTVSANPGIAADARLYMCTSNSTSTGTLTGFVDVGSPQYYSVDVNDNVSISSSRTSVSDFKAVGEVTINDTYSGTSKPLIINSDTGIAGHALYSKAFSGPAITADSSGIVSTPTGVIESIVGAVDNYYLWCSYGANDTFVGGVKADTASSVQYLTSSDYRLKENVKPLKNSIDRVRDIKTYNYNFIKSKDIHEGMIAHELEEIIPHAVSGKKDDTTERGIPIYQSIDYSRVVPLLTSALQEALDKIERLELKVENLENDW